MSGNNAPAAAAPASEPAASPRRSLSMLGDIVYGDDKPAEPPAAAPAAAPAAELEPPAGEGDEPNAAASDKKDDETEEVELSSISELAEHLQVQPDWLKTLKVADKINGQPVEFSISDAIATHMKVAAGDDYLNSAKEKAKGVLAEANQQRESLATTLATLGTLVDSVEADIAADEKGVDWAKLEQEDPALYAMKKQKGRERRERLDKMKSDARAALAQAAQKNAAMMNDALQKRLPEEGEKFIGMVPEWADAEKQKAERAQVVKYMTDLGFDQNDLKVAAFNGPLLATFVKAMRYDAAKKKTTDIARKKVVKIPKTLKPGGKTAAPAAQTATVRGSTLAEKARILYS